MCVEMDMIRLACIGDLCRIAAKVVLSKSLYPFL